MTDEEQAKDDREFREAMPLLGSIIEANARGLQWTNDQLLASKEAQLRQLQKSFVKLYHSMEKVAERTDSATAYDALNRFDYEYRESAKGIADTKNSYDDGLDLQ